MLMRLQRGFSLAEMAIVLVIVGILMASGLGALSNQMSNQRFKESKQMLDRANEALIGFALANNRLPCPADPALANAAPLAGKESRNGAGVNAYRCTIVFGDLPWVDLGLPELDAWGRRLKYQVTTFPTGGISSYASDLAGRNDAGTPNCGSAAVRPCFSLNNAAGIISVYSASSRDGVAVTPIKRVSDAAAVIFSEGPNGAGSGADELENRDAVADGTAPRFVQDTPDANFDDMLVWLPTTALFYRLVAAERLP